MIFKDTLPPFPNKYAWSFLSRGIYPEFNIGKSLRSCTAARTIVLFLIGITIKAYPLLGTPASQFGRGRCVLLMITE